MSYTQARTCGVVLWSTRQLFGFYHGLLSGDAALSSMLPLLQHDNAVDCVPLVYPATPLEVDPGTFHGFSDGFPRVPPMTDVFYSKPFIANTWSATSTQDAIKAIAAAPRISGQNSGNTGMSLNRLTPVELNPGPRGVSSANTAKTTDIQ
ncbi:uncharacterized protein LOC142783744 [Rhipicephalus microplus]|uniref:uncharacterized protein LOC142783744 n=1 Tax=Rhipicephalus microplus TaxID=6941 RepID=UPI003F6D9BF7